MLSPENIEFVECAIAHACLNTTDGSKKCAFCLIDYQFIANKPTTLDCDHHICKECQTKTKNGKIWCKICKSDSKCLGKVNIPVEIIISGNLKELTQTLADKFKLALSLLKGT